MKDSYGIKNKTNDLDYINEYEQNSGYRLINENKKQKRKKGSKNIIKIGLDRSELEKYFEIKEYRCYFITKQQIKGKRIQTKKRFNEQNKGTVMEKMTRKRKQLLKLYYGVE